MKANFKREVKKTKTNIRFGGNEGKRALFVPGGATTRDKRAFCPGSWLHPGQKVFLGGPAPLVPGGSSTRDKRGPFSLIPAKSFSSFFSFYFSFKIGIHLLIE